LQTLKEFIAGLLEWTVALLKIATALLILAIAKVTLRTNPEIAIPVLSISAIIFLGWFFAPKIKNYLNK